MWSHGLQLSPGWLTTFLLALLMTFMTWKLAVRGVTTWKLETKQMAAVQPPPAAGAAEAVPDDLTQPLLSTVASDVRSIPLAPTPPPGDPLQPRLLNPARALGAAS